MLQIRTREEIDIFQMSKLLVKYNITAHISNQDIVLDGNISDELLIMLQNSIKIVSVQNYTDSDNTDVIKMPDSVPIIQDDDKKDKKVHHQKQILSPQIIKKYDLKYPFVEPGEAY